MKTLTLFLVLLAAFIMVNACATSETATKQSTEEINQILEENGLVSNDAEEVNRGNIQPQNNSLLLSDYLKRVSGVNVTRRGGETLVRIRGLNSLQGNTHPLFVINGSQIGHSYAAAAHSVDVEDIDFISVLKGNEASQRYGSRGAAGVIEIFTK